MIDKDTKEALRILARLFHFDGHMSQMDAYKLKQQGSKLNGRDVQGDLQALAAPGHYHPDLGARPVPAGVDASPDLDHGVQTPRSSHPW